MPEKTQENNATKKGHKKSSGGKHGKGKGKGRRHKKEATKIMTVSWNMGNAMSDCFDRILPFQGGSYDIIALGLQESTYSIKQTSSSNIHDKNKTQEDDCVLQLLAQVKEILTDEFYMVAHNKRAQMQQLVFARNDLRRRISNINLHAENTGFFHIFPNKGGLSVIMNIDATRIAFISCHLAAHEGVDKCAIRNSSVGEILGSVMDDANLIHHSFFMGDMNYRCTFSKDTPATILAQKKDSTSHKKDAKSEAPTVNMEEENSDDEGEEVEGGESSEKKKKRQAEMNKLHTMITKEKWPELLALDELTREMAAKRVLCGYQALVPSFPPTFKRIRDIGIMKNDEADLEDDSDGEDDNDNDDEDVTVNDEDEQEEEKKDDEETECGTDVASSNTEEAPKLVAAAAAASGKPQVKEYNLSMKEKGEHSLTKSFYHHKRLPSFTDRILTSSLPGFVKLLAPVSFNSCEDACSSDHKPVIGVFKLRPRRGLKDILSYSPNLIAQGSLQYSSSTTYRVKGLRATNLTEMDSQLFGGGSDPYCTFTADPAGILVGNTKKMRTKTINHELNPNWVHDEINFRLATNDVPGLSRNCHFIFSVWDYDVGNADDLIGSAYIPLSDMFEHFESTDASDFHFELELLRDGLSQGFLEGCIEIGGMKDISKMVTYNAKKDTKTLYETIKNQDEADALNSKLGCGCVVS